MITRCWSEALSVGLCGSGGGERGGEVIRTFLTFDEDAVGIAGHELALRQDFSFGRFVLWSGVGVEA